MGDRKHHPTNHSPTRKTHTTNTVLRMECSSLVSHTYSHTHGNLIREVRKSGPRGTWGPPWAHKVHPTHCLGARNTFWCPFCPKTIKLLHFLMEFGPNWVFGQVGLECFFDKSAHFWQAKRGGLVGVAPIATCHCIAQHLWGPKQGAPCCFGVLGVVLRVVGACPRTS